MFKIKSATRLALTIGFICASLLWLSVGLQIVPNPFQPIIKGRVQVTKSVAASVTAFAENQRFVDMQTVLDRVVSGNDELISIGVRRNGRYYAHAGPHLQMWKKLADTSKSTENQLNAKINANDRDWGHLELLFQPMQMHGISGMLFFPLPLVAFMGCSLSLGTWYVLNKTFKYMNPARVVPGRVKSAFDTLAEGLLLIDNSGDIVHANQAFCKMVNVEMEGLIGGKADELDWGFNSEIDLMTVPWNQCLAEQESVCGEIMEVKTGRGEIRKYIVNATLILGEGDKTRGVLASFDDVTALENKKTELANIIHTLRRSRDEIERKNEQLNILANYDQMTKCMNRRAFWVHYEQMWNSVEPSQLSIMMVDVDHFKLINDNHGHSVGDEVLKAVGNLLHGVVNDQGAVCRYGGEEFTVLLPNMEFDEAIEIAERVGQEFRDQKLANLDVTVSIGVSNRRLNAMDPQHMLDQADQCLYVAKRNGRDRVVRFDDCPQTTEDEGQPADDVADPEYSIEYSSVTGLLSALAFRSSETCQHSLRVADLSVMVGKNMMSRQNLYTLEVAALLHDIGKIGVPDEILNKPGALTTEEWKVTHKHDDIGIEIVRSAFATDDISQIIAAHHHRFSVQNSENGRDSLDERISACSRIITVCDAFDAMVSDRVYRNKMNIEDATNELRRCSPDQFDPEIVEKLVGHVNTHGYSTETRAGFGGTSKSAVSIGKHIESLYEAIQSEDTNLLQRVVEELKVDAMENQIEPIADAAVQLNDAIDSDGTDLMKILDLADEVMKMCRLTRTGFITTAEETMADC